MLFKDIGISLPSIPLLWCDNVSAIALASNPVFHARTKHIEVDYHFVREKVVNRDIEFKFISSHDQIADVFTKGLSSTQFLYLKSKLMVVPPIRLRGLLDYMFKMVMELLWLMLLLLLKVKWGQIPQIMLITIPRQF
jgi:hypothetical protein